MRVVSGSYRGRKLKALQGEQTRPTTDKVKESIFNIIGPYFTGEIVLDLFSGSGGLAIEAVSRGCEQAVCIDRSFAAIQIIRENILVTKETEKFIVKKMDANRALEKLSEENYHFDLVFLDPPYAKQEILQQIQKMQELELLSKGALLVCETDQKVKLPDDLPGFILKRRQMYGGTEIVIYVKEEMDE